MNGKPDRDDGLVVGPWGLLALVVIFISIWPVTVWHGYGGPTGNDWRWDIHSTIAEAVWLGLVAFVTVLVVIGNRPAKRLPSARPPAPRGPDPAVTARLLRELDAAEGYAGLVEDARSGEELDYLTRNGKLPDGWPFRDTQRKEGS